MNRLKIILKLTYSRRMICGYVLWLSVGIISAQQSYSAADRNALYAQEEFRLGVQAYNRYSFNEAILSFERALSFQPGEPRFLDWLGRAYYRSGLEETALRQWRSAVAGYAPASGEALLLGSRIETVRNRRSLLSIVEDGVRYVESGRYPGQYKNTIYFRQPTSILPLEDGTAWVVAYGSNELVQIDVNGIVRRRLRGPLNGFDRPYDLAQGPDGRMFVSEYRGGRVSVLNAAGEWQYYIGTKGQGAGSFVGPQNIAVDEAGYLFVVDYGTRRISKFDPDGTFILDFGNKTPGFPGFLSPTGLAVRGGRVYVADNATKQIYMFDGNGIYLGILLKDGLFGPESLRFLADGRLLAADTNRIILIDVDSAIIRSLGAAGNTGMRIVGAAMDQNGNILVANFQKDEVAIMTRSSDMASGIFVQIERVVADRFPLVTVEISVEDRLRRPIVGLDARNFLLSEKGHPVGEQNFLGAGYRSNNADITILMERSPYTLGLQEDLVAAVRDIVKDFTGTVVSVVSAGEQPVKERIPAGISGAARGNNAAYSPNWRFDLGLRLAATDILPGEKKRAVVFVGAGSLGDMAFEQYSLAELSAYLANNSIIFHAVIVGDSPADDKIRYLCAQTGGQVMSLYRPEGVSRVIKGVASAPNGSYLFSYRSQLATDFGRAYLPLEVEVYLMERSGRDTTGYFPPLE
ncbi:MAG: NHL repeat-containing protein [Spirochaetaceae bacterium]|jgi:DNA-binding beta-propeller fold protein YncE|nr:NHL repeat-containing protein [Spirochaetaceae bacterium]